MDSPADNKMNTKSSIQVPTEISESKAGPSNPVRREDLGTCSHYFLSYSLVLNVKACGGDTILHKIAKNVQWKSFTFEAEANSIEKYLESGGNVNATNDAGHTALYYACGNGHGRMFKILLNSGADVNLSRSESAERPIHQAVKFLTGSSFLAILARDMVSELLEQGAYVDAATTDGTTPILIATGVKEYPHRQSLILNLLDWGCDVNCADARGVTPLRNLCEQGSWDMVHEFVKHGADLKQEESFMKNAVDFMRSRLQTFSCYGAWRWPTARNWLHEAYGEKLYTNYAMVRYLCMLENTLKRMEKMNISKTGEVCRTKFHVDYGLPLMLHLPDIMQSTNPMKSVEIDERTNLFDILEKEPKDLVRYLRNEKLIDVLSDTLFDHKFCELGNMLRMKLKRAVNREILCKAARDSLVLLFNLDMPHVYERICSYLENKDLINIIETNESREIKKEIICESAQDDKRRHVAHLLYKNQFTAA